MNNPHGVSEEELHAFIDGEVDSVRAAQIEGFAAADPEFAERLAAFRADKARLRQAYDAVLLKPLPQHWLRRIEEHARPAPRGLPAGYRMAAALAAGIVLLLGLGIFYERIVLPKSDAIVAEALAARQNTLVPQQVIAVNARTPSSTSALNSALAMNLKIPDLGKLGYRFAGMRIFNGVPGGRAVELDYRDAQGRLFTLYLRHPSGPARVDILERGVMRICLWQDDELGTVMAGEMSAGEMARLASLAYSGLYL